MSSPLQLLIATGSPSNVLTLAKERIEASWFPEAEEFSVPASLVSRVEAMFCTYLPANIEEMTSLRWIQIASVGFTPLLPFKLGSRGIAVTNARGVFDAPIGEWCVAMMINLLRDVRGMIANQEIGVWDRDVRFQRELRGLTVGIWGYGGIGRETARLAKALGMRVHVLNRSGRGSRADCYSVEGTGDPDGSVPSRFFALSDKEEFLASLDFLVVAMPLNPETEGLIGERELLAMPRGSYVLNPARGPIIQEEALLAALRSGHLGGAALDTHYCYPMPADHPLWHFRNVFMTPHISGSDGSPHFASRLWRIFEENLERFTSERPLLNLISPADLG